MLGISGTTKIDDQHQKIDMYILYFQFLSFRKHRFSEYTASDLFKRYLENI